MHPARSWPQRTLPVNFWIDLANILAKRGWIVLCIGTKQDWGFNGHRVLDLRDRFDMQMQACGDRRVAGVCLLGIRSDDAGASHRCAGRCAAYHGAAVDDGARAARRRRLAVSRHTFAD